jgi:cyanophycinase-like exopeptidase
MGSGELTGSMVEVHKSLLARLGPAAGAVFLDTPAGFQPNVEQIAAGAVEYFHRRVLKPMTLASFKSRDHLSEVEKVVLLKKLRHADYILMGPGSPTYTVEQLRPTPIPAILVEHVRKGGCLVAASAAALTMGRFTLPVYEIYKVGQRLHWIEGLNILAHFGINLTVIPHWNNSDGGNHDTNHCFMGRDRFARLRQLLKEPAAILGLDEHTACIIDLAAEVFGVHGKGEVVLLQGGQEQRFRPGQSYPLELLRAPGQPNPADQLSETDEVTGDFQHEVQALQSRCLLALTAEEKAAALQALLELDHKLWKNRLTEGDAVERGRQLFREMLVAVANLAGPEKREQHPGLREVIDALLAARQRLRQEQNWAAADALREALAGAGIVIADTEAGSIWSSQEVRDS